MKPTVRLVTMGETAISSPTVVSLSAVFHYGICVVAILTITSCARLVDFQVYACTLVVGCARRILIILVRLPVTTWTAAWLFHVVYVVTITIVAVAALLCRITYTAVGGIVV